MSHMVKINLQIKDLQALESACKRLGLQFVESASLHASRVGGAYVGLTSSGAETCRARYWGGAVMECDAVIRIPGCNHDIAVRKQDNGCFSLHADFYGQHGEKVRKAVEQLRQLYAVEVAKKAARRKGYSVYEQECKDGTIRLRISVQGR